MARPVTPRSPAEHLVTLSRLSRSIELDERISPRRKALILTLVSKLMTALQKELTR